MPDMDEYTKQFVLASKVLVECGLLPASEELPESGIDLAFKLREHVPHVDMGEWSIENDGDYARLLSSVAEAAGLPVTNAASSNDYGGAKLTFSFAGESRTAEGDLQGKIPYPDFYKLVDKLCREHGKGRFLEIPDSDGFGYVYLPNAVADRVEQHFEAVQSALYDS